MNKLIKLIFVALILISQANIAAELPSWGMTEDQYKLPNFSTKMGAIGKQAMKRNWQLKITAPGDWHDNIRDALTNRGEREVQMSLKDSVYQSISITATPGAKIARVTPSSGSDATVHKQVVIEKPEMDLEVEAPDFDEHAFEPNKQELLDNLAEIDLGVPTVSGQPEKQSKSAVKPKKVAKQKVNAKPVVKSQAKPKSKIIVKPQASVSQPVKSVAKPQPKPVKAVVKPQPQKIKTVVNASTQKNDVLDSSENVEASKETLRKRHARTKRVDKFLNYANIKKKDQLFIDGEVVLVKRFINQGVVRYYWMKESYNPAVHQFIEKGRNAYAKDPEAIFGDMPAVAVAEKAVIKETIDPTKLNFLAIDTMTEDQDELRREFIRNKRVEYTTTVDKLKADDILYVKNQTVLVERKLSQARSIYYWLVGDTTINREVENKGDNRFVIK